MAFVTAFLQPKTWLPDSNNIISPLHHQAPCLPFQLVSQHLLKERHKAVNTPKSFSTCGLSHVPPKLPPLSSQQPESSSFINTCASLRMWPWPEVQSLEPDGTATPSLAAGPWSTSPLCALFSSSAKWEQKDHPGQRVLVRIIGVNIREVLRTVPGTLKALRSVSFCCFYCLQSIVSVLNAWSMQGSPYHKLIAYFCPQLYFSLLFPKTSNGILISLKTEKQQRLRSVLAASGNAKMNQAGPSR